MAMIWGTLSRRGSLMRNPVVGRFEKPSPFAGGRPGFERLLMPCRGIPSGCPTIQPEFDPLLPRALFRGSCVNTGRGPGGSSPRQNGQLAPSRPTRRF